MGILQDALLQKKPGLPDREPCRVSLSGGISAGSERRHIRILAGYDMDRFQRYAQDIGGHLGKSRISPLPDLRLTQLNLKGTVRI